MAHGDSVPPPHGDSLPPPPGHESCGCAVSYVEPACACPPGLDDVSDGAGPSTLTRSLSEMSIAETMASVAEAAPPPTAKRRLRDGSFDDADDAGDAMEDDDGARCDACPYCYDVCADPACARCAVWRTRPRPRARGGDLYSPCEVRRHCTAQSCWLVVGRDVYDATPFLPRHPAGTRSIVRKAGGTDCTEDLGFHSGRAQKIWQQHKIGRLEECGSEAKRTEGGESCAIM